MFGEEHGHHTSKATKKGLFFFKKLFPLISMDIFGLKRVNLGKKNYYYEANKICGDFNSLL